MKSYIIHYNNIDESTTVDNMNKINFKYVIEVVQTPNGNWKSVIIYNNVNTVNQIKNLL